MRFSQLNVKRTFGHPLPSQEKSQGEAQNPLARRADQRKHAVKEKAGTMRLKHVVLYA